VEGSDDAIVAVRLDGVIAGWNRGAEELYGYRSEDITGSHISVLYPEDELEVVAGILASVARGERHDLVEGVRRRRDGSTIEVEVRVSPVFNQAGTVVGASAIARSIGDQRRRERELRESQAFLEQTQEIGHIGSWRARIGPESVLTWTPEAYRIFGMSPGSVVRNLDFFNMIHPDDRQLLMESFIKVRTERARGELEVRITRPDGVPRWLLIAADAVVDHSGAVDGLSGVVQDITERKHAELGLMLDAFSDQLTGLPNRGLFLDRVGRAITHAQRNGTKAAVMYLNLDRFERFNDARGREQGDALLRAVADRLRGALRATDTVARFGADDFGLVCESVATAAEAAERAERVLATIEHPFALDGPEAQITASVGIAVSDLDASAESMVRDAELAMHRAKEQGRNRFELYDLGLRQQVQQRFAFEASLRGALDGHELFLEFQPIASIAQGRYVGAEALVRWRHPERGVVQPNDFISVAEESGLIVPIGTWVLDSACRQLRAWRDAAPGCGDWSVSVNVAGVQLRSPEFADVVSAALARAELEPSSLCLELTESTLIDGGVVTDLVSRLHQLGVRISIDDFGTKYSSLSYLTRLAIDELKIDQSFVQGLETDRSSRAVVGAIVAIGRSLALPVTAEGVETEVQLRALQELGCETFQGFYFARPGTPDACLAQLVQPLGMAAAR
jgi:diguanylate cyclase (GGDEF)-like protein/PAS domain S-box-containing protein